MRRQTMIVLALALTMGGVAAAGVLLLSMNGSGTGAAMDTIVVATADVPRGESITTDTVAAKPYPRDLIPAGVLRKIEDAVGRAAMAPLVINEPILDNKLAVKGSGRGLASLIKKGMRAIAVQTPNIATGVAGFIVPGNRVDVLLALNDNGRQDRDKDGVGAITLLENVEILAVDQKVDAPAENRVDGAKMQSVTLAVTPEQATRLTLGQTRGTIHISLRNSGDDGHAANPSTSSLLGAKPWSERASQWLGVIAMAAKNRPPIPTPAPAPAPAPAPPAAPVVTQRPTLRLIRTFHGAREGVVQLDTPR